LPAVDIDLNALEGKASVGDKALVDYVLVDIAYYDFVDKAYSDFEVDK
jgi:hypothetical protein